MHLDVLQGWRDAFWNKEGSYLWVLNGPAMEAYPVQVSGMLQRLDPTPYRCNIPPTKRNLAAAAFEAFTGIMGWLSPNVISLLRLRIAAHCEIDTLCSHLAILVGHDESDFGIGSGGSRQDLVFRKELVRRKSLIENDEDL